jgi:hypothetical protein
MKTMKWNNKMIRVFGLVLCLIMLLMGCAGLHTSIGKDSTGGMVKITKKRIHTL